LGRQPMRQGRVCWREINHRAQTALANLGLELDVSQPLSFYSISIQQMVAIARALDISARLLILDEPTSSLDIHEVQRLFTVLRKLKAQDLGIVFITHFLDQAFEIADRITVLRNGRLVGEFETATLSKIELVAKMLGKEITEIAARPQAARETPAGEHPAAFLRVRGIGKRGALQPLDMEIAAGEVLGLAGLLGSGRTEAAKLLFGVLRADGGVVILDGRPIKPAGPRRAIRCRFGFCPEDRQGEGLLPELSVRENIILAIQARRGWSRPLPKPKQTEIVDSYIHTLDIATPSREQKVRNLSGGNQQKVILARWLASQPRFLILDEPTRGIDVGAKQEIEELVASLCAQGLAILFISSELEEVVRRSHRVIVLRDRVKIAELSGESISEQSIMNTIAGHG
jgi:monosaccharide-transporting ATPase